MPLKTARCRWSSEERPHSPPRSGAVSNGTGSRPLNGFVSAFQRPESVYVAEACQQPVIGRAREVRVHRDDAPIGIGTQGTVRGRVVRTSRRIEGQVDILD